MNKCFEKIIEYKYIVISILLILIFVSPYFILGQGVYIPIWDNLDSIFLWHKVLVDSGQLFGHWNDSVTQFINGIPRNLLSSEFNVVTLLFSILKPLTTYAVADILSRFIGFWGMYLLLKNHFLEKNKNEWLISGISCAFALIPIWSALPFLTIFGQPLLLNSFLNIRKNNFKLQDWIIITLIPFCLTFALITPFIIISISLVWLYDVIKTRKINFVFVFSILFFACLSLMLEYRLILISFFTPGFVPHRVEFNFYKVYKYYDILFPFSKAFWYGLSTLLLKNGQEHSVSMSQFIIMPISFLAIIIGIIKKNVPKNILTFLFIISFIGIFYGLFSCWGWFILVKENFPFLKEFDFSRFCFIVPMFWYITFALSLNFINNSIAKKWGNYVIYFLLIAQILLLFVTNYTFANSVKFIYHGENTKNPSYSQYFAEEQFNEIRDYINKPQQSYRVLSLGLSPTIASYNGFYTLDGYFVMYPLDYKHKFRKIIEKELNKSNRAKSYYDDWGSRIYLFANDQGDPKSIDLNSKAIRELNGEYIFSTTKIKNDAQNNLRLLKIFKNSKSIYTIYLYKVL